LAGQTAGLTRQKTRTRPDGGDAARRAPSDGGGIDPGREGARPPGNDLGVVAWVFALLFLSYQVEGKFGPWAAAGAVVGGLTLALFLAL
jgi:hypothetical protein